MIVLKFTDDYGNSIIPCELNDNAYMSRYYFYKGE